MFDLSSLTDYAQDLHSDIDLIDPSRPFDAGALLPFVGAPFAYHQFRSGRSNWASTVASLGIGIGVTEGAFFFAGRRAGFTSTEWFLARTASALGVRYGGRSLMAAAFFEGGTAAGASWGLPLWFSALLVYEGYRFTDAQFQAYAAAGAPNVYFDPAWAVEFN